MASTLAAAGVARAHPPPRAARELVRLQGHREIEPKAGGVVRRLTLVAQGTEQAFFATDWQQFGFTEEQPAATPQAEGLRFTLQASSEVIARFAAARPDQTVTILADHRPGSSDLFVLALDLCPPTRQEGSDPCDRSVGAPGKGEKSGRHRGHR